MNLWSYRNAKGFGSLASCDVPGHAAIIAVDLPRASPFQRVGLIPITARPPGRQARYLLIRSPVTTRPTPRPSAWGDVFSGPPMSAPQGKYTIELCPPAALRLALKA